MTVDLEQRALIAAGAVATAHGLAHEQAVVVASGSNVLVRLRPAPVVARVMTGTVVLHDDPARWLAREVSLLEFLAPSGLAVAPSPLIAPGPYRHDDLWMSFVEWLPDAEPASGLDDARRFGRALRELHEALRPYDGELAGLGDLGDDIARLHRQLRPGDAAEAATIAALGERLELLRATVFASALPPQALHGDVSLGNLLRTPRGLVWNDFEDCFRGPVHWDVAGYAISLRNRGADPRVVREMLDGYGWGDEAELAPFFAAHGVYDEIWRIHDRQRRA